MPSPFERAMTLSHATANRLAGITVVYRRPGWGKQVTLVAGLAETRVERGDAEGAVVRERVRDYILTVADLVFDGVPFLPQEGDQILETVGAATFVMDIRPPVSDGKAWRYHGPTHDAIRVHTMQRSTEG